MGEPRKPLRTADPGLRALVLAIEREAYYQLNARIVHLQRCQLAGRISYVVSRACWWRVADREGFYQFDDNGAW